jgi:hypothetical protein
VSIAADVVKAIDDGYEKEKREKPRRYIGASIIGAPCDAVLAYNLRGFPNDEPDARLKRIFGLGHVLEDMVVKDLKQKADVRVWEVDGLTSKQHSYEAWGGHIVCHMDGHIEVDGELMVLEIKSMNDASFNKFKKDGVKFSHPRYYGQLQMMMGMSDIPKSFFIAINKNNSEYHAETVEYDEFEYAHIKERVERAILGTARKISVDSTDWRCRGCFKRSVCWGGLLEVPRECATCGYAQASPDGAWHCNKHDKNATDTCDDYKVYEPLPKE